MIRNRFLLFVAVSMVPIVVISFSKSNETNFILKEKNVSSLLSGLISLDEEDNQECDMSLVNIDSDYTIRVKRKDGIVELPLEEYIVGVVAGEMPASFELEALKAQAVAARTYALYRKGISKTSYDVTDDTRTQVYIDKDRMRSMWGDDYTKYYNKILKAISDTKNQVITYDGNIIEAFYFAISGGNTQSSEYVFNVSRDYLKGVDSMYEDESIKGYQVTREYTMEEIKKKLDVSCSKLSVDYIKYNSQDYVEKVSVCGKEYSGIDFSYKVGLRSSNFSIEIKDKVRITTKGFGHGVGMSQYGANGYANAGYSYEDIIKHYYTNVEITSLKNV